MAHFLQDVEITNFKSIRHQKIEGCRRINVFIGAPNVGKSNVLEALGMMVYAGQNPPVLNSICRVERITELFFDYEISQPSLIRHSRDHPVDWQIRIAYGSEKDAKLLYEKIIVEKHPALGDVFETVKEYGLRNDGFSSSSDFENKASNDTDAFVSKLEQVVVRKYSFRTDVNRDASLGVPLAQPFGQNLFQTILLNKSLRSAAKALLENFHLELLFESGERTSMEFIKRLSDDTGIKIRFHQIADTLQRLMFYKAAIATNENAVLLLEEPEAHMFPPYIKLFTNDIIDKGSNQYFLTTHSPFVLHEFLETHAVREELSIYAVGLQNGETTIKRLTDEEVDEVYQYGVDLFFNIESYVQ